jgi:hypothetical protein
MRRVTKWAAFLAIALSTLAVAPPAEAAKPKVAWVSVDVPNRQDGGRVQKLLKQALARAAKKANFGNTKAVSLSARVVELSAEERGDVLRITCMVMGRVVGGAGARSRISYGGSPEKRDELEKEVLTQVANGLVARLAQIVRTQGPPRVKVR